MFFVRDDGTPRGGRIAVGIVAAVLVVGLFFATLIAWPFKKVPTGLVGLSYGGGLIESNAFQGEHVGPTSLFVNGFGDHLYMYPSTQRNYIVSLNAGEGDRGTSDAIEALDADGVVVKYEVAVYFKLNLDKLQEFHENIGIKYHAWCNGNEADCSEGWINMLNDSFRQQLENALQTSTRSYHTDAFLQADTLRTIQTSVASSLKENVNGVLGDDYFCGPSYIEGSGECPDFRLVIKKPTLPDAVVARYSEVQQSLISIQTKQNEVKQAELESEAIAKRQAALESCGQTCILYEAIKSGKIDFWVIPADTGLTLQTPQRTGS